MKIGLSLLPLLILLCSYSRAQQESINKEFPLVKASKTNTDYRIGDTWYHGWWSIAPEIENDTLLVNCYNSKENFVFKTDLDSIAFKIKPYETKNF